MSVTGSTAAAGLFFGSLALLAASGVLAAALVRRPRAAGLAAAGGGVFACALGLVSALATLLGGGGWDATARWSVPGGVFHAGADALSAFFLVPVFLLAGLGTVYGHGYVRDVAPARRGAGWLAFHLLTVSMALVLVARQAVLFLAAWELMTLSSFFLVTFDHERPEVRRAGWVYLVASQAGVAFLIALFFLLGRGSGSLEFDRLAADGAAPAGLLFALALAGFGTKAGFVPLHGWLPEAHPAAPSHVSAVMSGVMIKTGIYGLLRSLEWLGPAPVSWGWALVAVGAVSGVQGVLSALAQHDLKRLLAYHSVENIGIIALGLGIGVVGLADGRPAVAALGLAGGLFHVWNHALFKGLLFLGAGAAAHAAGTREMDRMGGLMRRMPWTGAAFLVGAAAIAGLPPLNGFASEWLVFLGGFEAVRAAAGGAASAGALTIGALALIGGLAVACFVKAFGIVFLGEPRSDGAAAAHEQEAPLRLPMAALAALCILLGLAAPLANRAIAPVVSAWTEAVSPGKGVPAAAEPPGQGVLAGGAVAGLALWALAGGLAAWRRRGRAARPAGATVTWDCGYARPAARMQYTATSFARPLLLSFGGWMRSREDLRRPEGPFPSRASFASHPRDAVQHLIWEPLRARIAPWLERARSLQHGRVHSYVLYIALTLLALLIWNLRGGRP